MNEQSTTQKNSYIDSSDTSSHIIHDYSSDYTPIIGDISRPEVSDDNTSSNSSDEQISSNPESFYDTVELYIETIKPYYYTADSQIDFVIYTNESYYFSYKTDFFLQYYKNDKWEYYPTKNGIIDYKFETKNVDSKSVVLTLNLEEKYDLPLLSGKYRIIQESDDDIIISNEFQIMHPEFWIEESQQSN